MRPVGLDEKTVTQWIARVAAERVRRAPPPGFPDLPDIPAGRYTDHRFFDTERRYAWQRSWLYAAHIDQISEPGRYLVWPFGSAPIVLLHGDDGFVRAFYNTCRHRGAPVVRDVAGQAGKSLVCGYHGWRYDRSGRLRGLTETRDWGKIDKSCKGLIEVRCERFGNWLFVNEYKQAPSLRTFLEPVARYMDHLALTDLRLVNRRVIELECHYKLLVENFLEAYHFNRLHPGTTHRIFDNRGTNVHLWRHGHSMMLSPFRRQGWSDPGAHGMPEMAGATAIEREHNPSYSVFPNLILPIAASGIPAVAIWPRGIAHTVMEILWFAPEVGGGPRDPLWATRIANFDRIVEEDIQFAGPMQASVNSAGFTGVPLSYQERRIYHWHEALDEAMGSYQSASSLRVEPRLEAWLE